MSLGEPIAASSDAMTALAASMPPVATMLVVDDQPLLADYLVCVAEESGWAAEATYSAAEFSRRMQSLSPDLIVLDLAMPDHDGIELLRQLAAQHYSGQLLIHSGCDRAVVETAALLARTHGLRVASFAQKPITADQFRELLEQVRLNSTDG